MKRIFTSGIVATALVVASFGAASFAASGKQSVVVSLDGEAGLPMKVDVDKTAIKAGVVEFNVKNVAIGTDHEVVLVKLTGSIADIVVDPKTHRIDEKTVDSMGEVSGLKPGDSGKLKVKLAAGQYVLLCNHKSHFDLGMAKPITVTN
jgi:uncharacterized cupredoxin-like copper-binding protein